MKFNTLDPVVLNKDVPRFGLKKGDLGAVVQVYEPDGLEVEFVTAAGRTQALALPVFVSKSMRRKAGSEPVPGMSLIEPATGTRKSLSHSGGSRRILVHSSGTLASGAFIRDCFAFIRHSSICSIHIIHRRDRPSSPAPGSSAGLEHGWK